MKGINILFFLLSSCSSAPQLASTIEDIATDNAIKLEVQKEAFGKNTNMHVAIDVVNKDPVK